MDQFVASGLFLLRGPLSTAGQPNGALSVDGRGRSFEPIDNGRGLLGSRSERTIGSSMLELNILKPRRRLAPRLRAGIGPLPSVASLVVALRWNKLGIFQADEKLIRRCLLLIASGSSADLGNDWLWPCLRVPRAGPCSCIVLPRALGKPKMPPNGLCEVGCSEVAADPMAPKSAL